MAGFPDDPDLRGVRRSDRLLARVLDGMLAIAVGNLVLMLYVGALSFLAGRTGKNFALMVAEAGAPA
ncbi:MAG: hypothetical protein ACRDRX_27935 [Pseudonocardiaceae bacterium]